MAATPSVFRHWRNAWRWVLLAACLAMGLLAACVEKGTVFPGDGKINFVDADCYSRMTRVREVYRHPGVMIRRHEFENYPFGVSPHTTVPLDYAIRVLGGVLGMMTGREAGDLAGAWISPLLGSAALIGVWWWLQRESPWAAGLTLLVLAGSPILAHGFELGRPDHQSLVLACAAWALAAEWAQWRAPSRVWGIVSGVAWGLGLWTSLYEPVILLLLVLLAGLLWNRVALFRRERLPGLLAGGTILLFALSLEGWRINGVPGFGESGAAEYFAAWSRQIGELASVPPWAPALYAWCGLGLLAAPVPLWFVRDERRPEVRAHLLLLAAVFLLTCWQVRWGYFLPLVYALSLPCQWQAVPVRWRLASLALLLAGLWPMVSQWHSRLKPSAEQLVAKAEQQADTAQLREVAEAIRQNAAEPPVAAESAPTDDGVPDAGILAPWWQSPALAYWSGQPAVAGSSHESLPGTVDTARFFLAEAPASAAILRRRRVRWIVAYEPERVLQTAGALLGQGRVSSRCMGELLYRRPDLAPRFLRLVLANPYFKVYEVRSAFLPPPA